MKSRRSRSSLKRVETGLSNILGKKNFKILAGANHLRRTWSDIVGPMLATHTEPVSIEHQLLVVDVDHPAMAQQVRFLEKEILLACSKRKIRGLKRIRTRFRSNAGAFEKTLSPLEKKTVAMGEKKRIARLVKGIRNPELKRAIYSANIAQLMFSSNH
ncbi:MAG: DciA family protein [Mariprofundus sp.]